MQEAPSETEVTKMQEAPSATEVTKMQEAPSATEVTKMETPATVATFCVVPPRLKPEKKARQYS